MSMQTRERVAIVTGASRGIGKAIVEVLAQRGHRVGCIARSMRKLGELREALGADGEMLLPLPCDIRHAKEVQGAVDKVLAKWGRIDVLVSNAGAGYWGAFEGCGEEDWDRTFDTNVKGAFLLVKAALPAMEARAMGHIFFISSMAQECGSALEAPFAASKRGLQGLARSLGLELREKGIALTLIAPGAVNTGGYVAAHQKSQRWYGVPALDFAHLVAETIERSRNVWVREMQVMHLGGESPGPDGSELADKMRAHAGELLLPVTRPVAPRAGFWISEPALALRNRFAPSFHLDAGGAGAGHTPKEALLPFLREGGTHLLGRAVFEGDAVARHPDLLEMIFQARQHTVRRFGMRSTAAGLDEAYLLGQLHRQGMDLFRLRDGAPDGDLRLLRAALGRLDGLEGVSVILEHPLRPDDVRSPGSAIPRLGALAEEHGCVVGLVGSLEPGEGEPADREAVDARSRDLLAAYEAAAKAAADLDLPFWVEGWPACLSPEIAGSHGTLVGDGAYHTVTREWRPGGHRGERARHAACLGCALFDDCAGFGPDALSFFGEDAFRPTGDLVAEKARDAAVLDPGEPAVYEPWAAPPPRRRARAAPAPAAAAEAETGGAAPREHPELSAAINAVLPAGLELAGATLEGGVDPPYELRGELKAASYRVGVSVVPREPGVNAFAHTRSLSISYAGKELGKAQQKMLGVFVKALEHLDARVHGALTTPLG